MQEHRISLRFRQPTEADWKAAEDDMVKLFDKYGPPGEWQPHLEREAQSEWDRICSNISECCDFEGWN